MTTSINSAAQRTSAVSGVKAELADAQSTSAKKQERKVIALRLPLDLFMSDKSLLIRSQKDGDRILQLFIFLLTLAAKAGYGGCISRCS